MNYKITLHGNNMYKEFVLDDAFKGNLTMGTLKECQICFQRERFYTDFLLRLDQQENNEYVLICSDTVFFKTEGALKKYVHYLRAGDQITICYDATESEFFYIDFSFDFERVGNDYNLMIDCKGFEQLTIGGATDCHVRIDNPILGDDYIIVTKLDSGYLVNSQYTRYGIEINGFSSRKKQSEIRNGEFVSLFGYSFYIKDDKLYTTKNAIVITKYTVQKIDNQRNHFKYPRFIRNVRQQYKISDQKIEVLRPKEKDSGDEQNILVSILPMLINMVLMVAVRGIMGGGGAFVIYFVLMMGASLILSIYTFMDNKKKKLRKEEKRTDIYMRYLAGQEDTIIKLREQERILSNQINPNLEEYINYVNTFDERLFEKEKIHEDYLSVRIGSGTVPSKCQVDYKQEEYVETEDELMNYPKAIHDKYEFLPDMPVTIDLKNVNAIGFVGVRTKLYQMEKNLIVEYAASHFYRDLKIFLVMDEGDVALFSWARWLQNTYNDSTSARNFMYDKESEKLSLEFLYSELSRRESHYQEDTFEDYIVFVYKSDVIGNHPVSEFVGHAKDLGFHFVFFEEYEEFLNKECEKRIFLNSKDYSGYIQDVNDGSMIQKFTYSHISKEMAAGIAKRLAGVYVDEVNLENSLTKNITLFELLDIMTPYDLNLEERWKNSQVFDSMAAPLGVKSGNEIVYLDLHEKYHGPHGLVAGTTGSGKSEIMQSYILSMATLFHPYEVGFIIIDFKGGGMVNQFLNLPHLNGAITNIDGKEINRSLMSIKAELVKRQELFAEQNVNHIDDYIRAYKDGKTNIPLPHLILIVDEFAELKTDQPEFMKELISAARIGRSLGVHLILATQKPSGVVNDQIWSNSKFKLCLKVQNKNDSNEVLKSPLAAEIREPGRAYLQVGNNEIFQLFQSAYSGAPAKNDGINNRKKFKIMSVELSGKRKIIYEQAPEKAEEGETQLDALVNYIHEFCEKKGIQRLPNVCLSPLAASISYSLEGYKEGSTDIIIPIGIIDDPSRQRQFVETLNFSQSNIYILGSSLSGKTCMLQSILYGITQLYSPEDVNIYVIDFASMILKNFEPLNHVGGVILNGEADKLKTFVKMLREIISSRKEFLSKQGLSSFSSYREMGEHDLSQIIVIIDNWISFKNSYSEYSEILLEFMRDSVSLGISFVVTSSQAGGVGFKMLANFNKRIALQCNDSNNYALLYEHCRIKPDAIPGRGLAEVQRVIYECQYYLSFAAEKEFERVKLIQSYIQDVKNIYGRRHAKEIPVMPEHVTEEYLAMKYGFEVFESYDKALGIEYNTFEIRKLPITKIGFVSILGGQKESARIFIRYIVESIIEKMERYPAELYICDNDTLDLRTYADEAVFYTGQAKDAAYIFNTVYDIAKKRKENLDNKKTDEKIPYIYVVMNHKEAITYMAEGNGGRNFREMAGFMRDVQIFFLFAQVENKQISFGASDIMKVIRDSKLFLCFEELKDVEITNVPVSKLKEFKNPLSNGDAYWMNGGSFEKIKLVEKI